MARPKPTRPTDTELAILNVLWQGGDRGLTIRQVVVELNKTRPSTYATIQTLVRIMEKKGLVERGQERYPAFYHPVGSEQQSKRKLVKDFIDRVFGGSMKQLMLHALSTKKSSGRELAQIQKIVEQMKD